MDITIQMRSIDLLIKMLKRDTEGIPQYGYARQKQPGEILPIAQPLPRCTPEEAGVSSAVAERLFRAVEKNVDSLGVHGMMLLRNGRVFAEGYWAPYRPEVPHMLYSASKSIISTAVGFAYDEGLIDLDRRLDDIFPEQPASPYKWARLLTLRHLLTMSTGIRFNEIGSALDKDWVKMFMESAPRFEPGTQFEYNSLNTYMLSAALCRITGQSITEYLTPRLYEPLGITNAQWEKCPMGIEKGGWGLSLCMEDLAKIAQLYLNRGMWGEKRLLSEEWIAMATSPQIATPNGEINQGYGFQIWMNANGVYQFNGAFGQYAVMFPNINAAAIIFSGSNQLFAKSSLMEALSSCLWSAADEPLPEYPEGCRRLAEYTKSLVFSPTPSRVGLETDPAQFDRLCETLHGREYRLNDNHGALFPQPLQSVHGCFSLGTDVVRFERQDENTLAVTFYEHYERNTLYVKRSGGFVDSRYGIKEEDHLVSTRGVWMWDEEEICLTLFTSFIETPDTRIIEMRMIGENMEIIFDETPSAENATAMLLELVGLMDEKAVKRLVPAMKHVPGFNENSMNELVKKYAAPRAFGRMIHSHS
ncbi:MAG: serine hydrolase [Clostridia bacterium]|nr:serine hydrolase [Clostridia bacterium]